jgi:hypothetical protein
MRSMIANVAHDLKTVRSIALHTIFLVLSCNPSMSFCFFSYSRYLPLQQV